MSKYVPEGKNLLKENKIILNTQKNLKEDLEYTFRQKPNVKFMGIPFKLFFYNMYDSARLSEKHIMKKNRFEEELKIKRKKVEKINLKRKQRAINKGKSEYYPKYIKDTLFSKKLWGERIKYSFGQPPVVYDTLLQSKTAKQMSLFLKKKGYENNIVSTEVSIHQKKRNAQVNYIINLGKLTIIDSIVVSGIETFKKMENTFFAKKIKAGLEHPLIGKPLDVELLDEHRYEFARFLNNSQYQDFRPSNIYYRIDTAGRSNKAIVHIHFDMYPEVLDKELKSKLNKKGIKRAKIDSVFFHLSDTINFTGSFFQFWNRNENIKSIYNLYDTINGKATLKTTQKLFYDRVKANKKFILKNPDLGIQNGDSHPYFEITLLYNGNKPWIKPELLALQTYLEHKNTYKLDYLERSFRSLQLLGVFKSIVPVLENSYEESDFKHMNIHYILEPNKKHSFGIEPRFSTNTTGLLGLSAGINYTNKNLGRQAQSFTFSFGGGFESQTRSLSDDENFLFNTLEIGPSLKFETPGLLPIPITKLSKRQQPRTVISSSFNLEKRSIFDREVFQLKNYWKFYVGKTQVFEIGLPGLSSVKFVLFNPKGTFEEYLNTVDDPFFRNTYSNQFIWEDLRFSWEYNNKDKTYKDGKGPFLKADINFQTTLNAAGNSLYAFKNFQNINLEGELEYLNIAYSQFVRLDNVYVLGRKIKRKRSIHFKYNVGVGFPYLNSKTSLPFDYSFYSGGANDNRGFRARTLGPGSYAYHLDPLRLPTQVGDIKLLSAFEYRFNLGSIFRGAVFSDVGNIWTFNQDSKRLGGEFEFKDFYKEIAISMGTGLRLDFDYFVFRLDISVPFYNPAFSNATKWYFTDLFTNSNFRKSYYEEGIPIYSDQVNDIYFQENGVLPTSDDQYWKLIKEYKLMPKPFIPVLTFGIGYPF